MLLADEALDADLPPEPPKPETPIAKHLDTTTSANAYLEGAPLYLIEPYLSVVLKQYPGQKVAVKLKEMELWAYSLGVRVRLSLLIASYSQPGGPGDETHASTQSLGPEVTQRGENG